MLNLLSFSEDTINTVIIIVGIALIVGTAILLAFYLTREIKRLKADRAEGLKNGPTLITADELGEPMFVKGDFTVLSKNVIYTVGENAHILPGKYLAKSSVSSDEEFVVLRSGEQHEYKNGSEIELSAGETVCALNKNLHVKSIEQ